MSYTSFPYNFRKRHEKNKQREIIMCIRNNF